MKKFFRSPYFWALFILLSLGSIGAALRLSPSAFPIVHIDVTMDTTSAFKEARALSSRFDLGPADFKKAASFETDRYFNTFVELEGGGRAALLDIIDKGLYQPYTWQVRHFKPFDAHEVLISFTPQGKAYGFKENLAEETVLPSLSEQEAQSLAEKHAERDWGLSLDQYELIESAQNETPGGRVDHTFVYQRKSEQIGEGRYRVRLGVKGDRFVAMTHFVNVPDEFGRRYQEMRALNERLSWISQGAVLVLNILSCGLIGLFFLIQRHFILWRWPLRWGAIIALLNALSTWNKMPRLWMEYSTTLDPKTFILNTVVQALFQFVVAWAFLTVLFATAVSLTRWAFPNQLRLTTIWRTKTASSHAVVGSTLAAYLLVPCIIAFQAAFYILTARYFHWWIPSEALADPNILGTYAPWLEPLTQALTAGSMEECLFRALPLASAALLGNRFGRRKSFIAIAFIVQALIFGSAHANYAMQPAYARIIELFIPSLIFGGLYLAFGLLPAIINHFVFDLVLMSMPIFLSSGLASHISVALIIVLGLIPLLVVIYALLKERRIGEPEPEAFNRSFVPLPKIAIERRAISMPPQKTRLGIFWMSIVLGLLGLVTWLLFAPFKADVPGALIKRDQAITQAHSFLSKHGYVLDDSWTTIAMAESNDSNIFADEFIWREGDKKVFGALLGRFIESPHWRIRMVRFSGPVEERAEEFQLSIDEKAQVYRFAHVLPEARKGAALSKDKAQAIARNALSKELDQRAEQLIEVSAVAQRLPERTDWYFIWSDREAYPLEQGRAEIGIGIAGEELSEWSKGIHVPEQWIRNKESEDQHKPLLAFFGLGLFSAILTIGMVLGFLHCISESRTRKIALSCFLILGVLTVAGAFNTLPEIILGFVTTKSYDEQMTMGLLGAIGTGLLGSMALSLVYAYLLTVPVGLRVRVEGKEILSAFMFALFFAGAQTAILLLFSHKFPIRPDLSALNSYVPFLKTFGNELRLYLAGTAFISLVVIFLNQRANQQWYFLAGSFAMMACGFVISVSALNNMSLFFMLSLSRGLILLFLWFVFFRYRPMIIPLFTATYFALFIVRESFISAYEHAVLYGVLSALLLLILGVVLFMLSDKNAMGRVGSAR